MDEEEEEEEYLPDDNDNVGTGFIITRKVKKKDFIEQISDAHDKVNETLIHVERIAKAADRMISNITREHKEKNTVKNLVIKQMGLTVEKAAEILGVDPRASLSEITQVYKEKISACRPDRTNDPNARKKFSTYHSAFLFLRRVKKQARRREYIPEVYVVDKKEETDH